MTSRRALLGALGTALSMAGCSATNALTGDSAKNQTASTTQASTRTTTSTKNAPTSTDTATNQTTAQTTETTTQTTTQTTTATTTDRNPADHAVASGLGDEPTLGPDPWDADAAIVLFSDPSCPYCQEFERETFPELVPHIERNQLSFAYRAVTWVAEWGHEASLALEATYTRNEDAFWLLRTWMYENPGRVSGDPAGAAFGFLQEQTDLEDPRGVMQDAKNGRYANRIAEDEDVAKQTGVEGVPGFVLIKEGLPLTVISGTRPYRTFRAILSL